MAKKKDTDLTLATDQSKRTGINKCIVDPEKMVPAYFTTTEDQL